MDTCGEHGVKNTDIIAFAGYECPACVQVKKLAGEKEDEIDDIRSDYDNQIDDLQTEVSELKDKITELEGQLEKANGQ